MDDRARGEPRGAKGQLLTVADMACSVALLVALVVASVSDLRERIVPNGCPATVAAAGVVRSLVRVALGGGDVGPLFSALLGAAVVFLVMLAAALISGRGGRGSGVGGGDVKLLAAAGAWTGPVLGLVTIGLSCLIGLAGWFALHFAIALMGRRPPERGGIPLAPAIALSVVIVVFALRP